MTAPKHALTNEITSLKRSAEKRSSELRTADDLEKFRIEFLARKGGIAVLFDKLKTIPADQKPSLGKQLNELRVFVESLFETKRQEFGAEKKTTEKVLDITLPGRTVPIGTLHPITHTLNNIVTIFASMGFAVASGPEIEDDFHNFEALNFPPDHPARDMQDTFFISEKILLRTHTSPVQIRVMEHQEPPIRVIMPGRVYRNEAISARSLSQFHQVEGLYVDRNVTFSELKGTLVAFAKEFYGSDIKYKFRPSFFPFTEPSLEMDITCFICSGKGCPMCKKSGWLEVLGAGMVHPNVFRKIGYDPEMVTGFAFGMGIERTTVLRLGIPDLRMLLENDIKFLEQF
ncbi:MAG: phenylalanine--tRNA ligase subunit alpha [Bacteroidota bacterium]|nr:phenylalanine--tRNA ligase subunit alpha [Bacteroidota bacterium]